MNYSLHVPLNGLSFGQVSLAILREIYQKGHNPAIFPIGNADLSAYKIEKEFGEWLQGNVNKANSTHSRKNPVIKLWHLEGSLESLSEKQVLLTFYELDSPTNVELNIVKNNSRVVFTNTATTNIFENFGCGNVSTVFLGFDKNNFSAKTKKYYQDNRIVFNLLGKFENRKRHEKVVVAWLKKYGNNPNYFLNCAIYNPFFKPEDNTQIWGSLLKGKTYFNVNFLGHMTQNELYNDFLNQCNIVISMSGAEGWGLGEFHSVALGKHCVGLYAHAHRDWMTPQNSVLVNPSSKIDAYDNVFFVKGRSFNQGCIYDFDENEFIDGCEEAIKRVNKDRVNHAGLELQKTFTYENTTNLLLKELEKI
jgi:glycosyltransferase involved in cell wall biosynthesis